MLGGLAGEDAKWWARARPMSPAPPVMMMDLGGGMVLVVLEVIDRLGGV